MKALERRAWSIRGALPIVVLGIGTVCGGAAGALAQATPVVTNNAAPAPPADTVGPRELRDFSLGGTRVSPAPDTPAPDAGVSPPRASPAARPPARSANPPAPRPDPSSATQGAGVAPATRAGRPPAAGQDVTAPPAREVTIPLPPADPLQREATPAPQTFPQALPSPALTTPSRITPATQDQGTSYWPWLLALAALAAGAMIYIFRDRGGYGRRREAALASGSFDLAPGNSPPPPQPTPRAPAPVPPPARPSAIPSPVAGGITVARPSPFPLQEAAPAPQPVPAPAPQQPAAARPIGIVSTRLRPWLEIAFVPGRAVIDEQRASVQFDVIVTNSGNAPARDILVEACMINAGPEQDAELRRFFEQPAGQGERIDAIPPLGKIQFSSSVALPLDQTRAFEVGGRKLFVPLVAFNALYGWGSNKGQSSASYLVGRGHVDGEGDAQSRMAPLRLDLGPRVFRDLDTRRHPLGVRV